MENKMINSAAHYFARRINVYANKEGVEYKKLVLGMEMMIINVTKLVVLYLLAMTLGVLVQTLTLHAGYLLIKRYSFGLHALNSTVCTMITCVMFAIVPWVFSGFGINNFIVIVVFVPVISCLYLYAPADTKARPLIGEALREKLKRSSAICGAVLFAIVVLIPHPHVKFLLTLGAVYQCLAILPLTYKLLKRSERNYEKYERV